MVDAVTLAPSGKENQVQTQVIDQTCWIADANSVIHAACHDTETGELVQSWHSLIT